MFDVGQQSLKKDETLPSDITYLLVSDGGAPLAREACECAHRKASEDYTLLWNKLGDEIFDVFGVVSDHVLVRIGNRVRSAEPPQIRENEAMLAKEREHVRNPHGPFHSVPVEHHHRWSIDATECSVR